MSAFNDYALEGFYDELIDAKGAPRPGAEGLLGAISGLGLDELKRRNGGLWQKGPKLASAPGQV
jgi:hypothetical protein